MKKGNLEAFHSKIIKAMNRLDFYKLLEIFSEKLLEQQERLLTYLTNVGEKITENSVVF